MRAFLYPVLAGTLILGGCTGRLDHFMQPPSMTPVADPRQQEEARKISMPMPAPQADKFEPNSLWRTGARSFLNDQRADDVGDIVKVVIDVDDTANLNNSSQRARSSDEGVNVPNFLGLESNLPNFLPDEVEPEDLVDFGSDSAYAGNGAINRREEIEVRVAATITEVLPNGNFVIAGRQEVRVNYELRELRVAGVIRPEDIGKENEINYDEIAEARLAYGGRGQITDVQQPRYGQQFYDIVFPF